MDWTILSLMSEGLFMMGGGALEVPAIVLERTGRGAFSWKEGTGIPALLFRRSILRCTVSISSGVIPGLIL